MATTYKQLATGATPTLGTSGAAVKTLQTQYNLANPTATQLKVDGLYGPLTQAALAPKTSTIPVPTYGSVNPDGSKNMFDPNTGKPLTAPIVTPVTPLYTESPEDKALREANQSAADYYKTNANSTIDEGQIRADTLAQFQAEINAQNEIYANKLSSARVAGKGRIGSDTAIQGRSGLLGSDFGAAQTTGINEANADIESSINAEKNAAIQALLSKARESGTAAIAAKRAAKEAGLTEYMASLTTASETKKKQSSEVAKLILSGKLDFEKDKNVIEKAATDAGLTISQIKNAYTDLKNAQDKADAEIAKANKVSQPSSVQEYEYAKAGGYTGTYNEYQNLDANRKASIARAGVAGSGFNNSQINSTLNSIAGAFDNEPVVRNFNILNEGYQFAKNMSNTTTNPSDDQGLIYAFAKAMDPGSVVREGEYATVQKYSQSLINSYGKSVSQALAGTGFLTADARANIKKTIESKYAVSKQNYDNVYKQYQGRINAAKAGDGNSLTDYSQAFSGSNTGGATDPLGIR